MEKLILRWLKLKIVIELLHGNVNLDVIKDKIFGLHDDIRHIIIADFKGEVLSIFSRAKKEWPSDVQKQFSGLIAVLTIGLSEKVQDIAGHVEYVLVRYEKLNIIIVKSSRFIYIISTRKFMPNEAIDRLVELIRREG